LCIFKYLRLLEIGNEQPLGTLLKLVQAAFATQVQP
jgi:hypothetical protein